MARVGHDGQNRIMSSLDVANPGNWYRLINRLMWIWRGIDPWKIKEVLARIAASRAPHTNDRLLDTVIGYRGGNWIYEWSHHRGWSGSSAHWKALTALPWRATGYRRSYPHLKGDITGGAGADAGQSRLGRGGQTPAA
ncbi:MAG: alpha/beta hydrolase [Sodalis sp. (in: enterobacteria)]|uniref:alpha/beta hydrolase n=1 Tax=Sodalis sp. (in: enterobacteria) TaxID=1898979 RepID=UPI003F36DEA6